MVAVSKCFQLGPQFWSRILFIYNHFLFTSQWKFGGNYKYSLHSKITTECASHGYLNSFIPYNVTFVDWEAVFYSMFLWGFEHHLNIQPVLQCEGWSALKSMICGWKYSWYQNISIPRFLSAEYAEVIQLLVRRGSDWFWTYSKSQCSLLVSVRKLFLYQ